VNLRTRVAATAAGAVLVAVVLVAVGAYASTQRQLGRELDDVLLRTAGLVSRLAPAQIDDVLAGAQRPGDRGERGDGDGRSRRDRGALLERLGGDDRSIERLLGPLGGGVVQVVAPDGTSVTFGPTRLPVDAATQRLAGPSSLATRDEALATRDGSLATRDEALATRDEALADRGGPYVREVALEGRPVRIVTVPIPVGGAVQVAAVVDGDDPALSALRRQLLLTGLLAAVLAGGVGLAVADRVVRPVRRLTAAAEDVRRTGDLGTRIGVAGDDEVGRLASSFNAMLGSLEEARTAQQQLVADASHELRTPVTSLRTNIEVLQLGADRLTPREHGELLRDVGAQLEELGRLVDGLVELARGDRPAQAPTRLVLAELVEEVVDRAAVFAPAVEISVEVDDGVVVAERDRLERAVANLIDNAVKHGGGAPVDVVVSDGAVRVRDHGPGIPEQDVRHVFERFYRSPVSRQLPGSGLGLSIVAQVARAHGGEVTAGNHPDGGAVVELRLPTAGRAVGS
jgi:two-component system sensor histidine kinase MprB